ncbi:DUF1189 domain-containing protein [Ectobacillus ponti]|uniref:DUF1189 domain-containing protein n=1 Tax=Ectobacillus ponti TaxID=2961894 RepID=A0AA41X200_9BACI|nr:DUF1189 domain-containing protein [Ectobacillus ponti]MCP8967142.1 DUF1189 domain-containing protein [Ectobacillus ponti]
MSVLTQFWKSLYSPKDMARFRFQKFGKAVLYIFLLSLLSVVPEITQVGKLFQTELAMMEETVETDIPDFTIEKGELKAGLQKPIVKEQSRFLLFFDPNATKLPSQYETEAGMFFLKNELTVIAPNRTETYPYTLLNDQVIQKKDIQEFLNFMHSILPIALVLLGVLLYLSDVFISFLAITLLAMIGQFMAGQLQRKLNYKQVWVLCVYSTTLPTVFFMIMTALNITVQFSTLIFSFVTLFMFYLIIKEIPAPKQKEKMPL